MIKKIFLSTIIGILILIAPQAINAQEHTADDSAQLKIELNSEKNTYAFDKEQYIKRIAMKRVLEKYNSPLIDQIDDFILVSRALGLDDYLLVSISGVESSFGIHIPQGSYNSFGYGPGIQFDNWSHSIATVGLSLKNKYIAQGADTLDEIGHAYAGGSTTWAGKVNHFMNTFNQEEEHIRRYYELL